MTGPSCDHYGSYDGSSLCTMCGVEMQCIKDTGIDKTHSYFSTALATSVIPFVRPAELVQEEHTEALAEVTFGNEFTTKGVVRMIGDGTLRLRVGNAEYVSMINKIRNIKLIKEE